MCELLGIGASVPIDIAFSFSGFVLRGGQTGPHADGWGVSLYDGPFARTFLEERPAFSSPLTRFLETNPIVTRLAVAHIRKKTRGEARLANTHPFVRVMHGRHLVFAHNGTLPSVRSTPLRTESPIGDTDSEHAFCVLLERLREAFPDAWPDDPAVLGATVFALANELGRDGVFNFLLADGRHLFARCGDNLCHIVRRAPLGRATLIDGEVTVDFAQILRDGGTVAVTATTPLTRDEEWVTATPGTLWVFRDGELVAAHEGLPEAAHVAATAWRPSHGESRS
ncbi:MAG TPA: class II glutamine amidotransferase [Candidatus Binatia bacterium]|jgi:glutamine amidotransferase|nr:class II glutamine amidotransferase [Candidatus Binatia bacterium]